MIKVVGTSKVDVNMLALEQLLNNILPDGFTDEMEIKMDARGNVKSTFMKIDPGTVAKCSIYTGAIETEWDAQFASTDNVKTQQEALIFISAFAVKKFLSKSKYDMKLANMPNIRVEDDFNEIKTLIAALVEKYNEIAPTVQGSVPSTSSVPSAKPATRAKAPINPNAGVPLEGTPHVDIPEDLDLVGGTIGVMSSPEEQIISNEAELQAASETEAVIEEETVPVEEAPVEEPISDEALDLNSALEAANAPAETEDVDNDEPLI